MEAVFAKQSNKYNLHDNPSEVDFNRRSFYGLQKKSLSADGFFTISLRAIKLKVILK